MDEKLLRSANYFEQLALNLDMDEGEAAAEQGISPEEARIRSEVARKAFEGSGHELPEREERGPTLPSPNGQEQAHLGREKSPWFEEYEYLRASGWPWRVAAFIAWSASPRKGREPKTQLELAQKVLGLNSDRIIYTWRKKNPAIDEVIGFIQSKPLFQHRRDLYEALVASATDPNYKSHQDRKLAFEMLGDHVPRTKVDVHTKDPNDLSEYTDEELKQLAANILKKPKVNDA